MIDKERCPRCYNMMNSKGDGFYRCHECNYAEMKVNELKSTRRPLRNKTRYEFISSG